MTISPFHGDYGAMPEDSIPDRVKLRFAVPKAFMLHLTNYSLPGRPLGASYDAEMLSLFRHQQQLPVYKIHYRYSGGMELLPELLEICRLYKHVMPLVPSDGCNFPTGASS